MKYGTVFYFRYINIIGGIETFFYQMAKKYKDRDITIIYQDGEINQINRLKKYVRVMKYNGDRIKCEKLFVALNLEIIDKVDADEYIQVLHGDYKAMGIKPILNPKVTRYIGVSKVVCDSFKEITGIDAELIYNPFQKEEIRKPLILISATRLTSDKGRNRMISLANTFDRNNIPYIWFVFTDNSEVIKNPNIIYMRPRLNIIDYISKADYLVQLSDAEGYCYSVVEALSNGVPVIVTDMPVIKELGVKNGENGFIVDFDMKDIPFEDIYNKKLKFEYKAKKDTWDKEITKNKSTYVIHKVRATGQYKKLNVIDGGLGFVPEEGYEFYIDDVRLHELENTKHKVKFVEVIDNGSN